VTEYESQPSGWATGGVAFAATMMLIIGIFQAIAGISAISKDDLFVVSENYVFDIDLAAWGWIHLLLGVVVILAGVALIAGKVWGGLVGIVLATLSAVANFFLIPYYPVWSIVIIALAVWAIWALTRPGIYRTA
jgi:hypothetical protein